VKVTAKNVNPAGGQPTPLRCPTCGKLGSFEPIGQDISVDGVACGHRRCPDPSCRCHVFVVVPFGGALAVSYPPSRVEFDASNIPQVIRESFEQALDCHAHGLHIAAAIMVRRTLEEVCSDRGAQGKNLKERIQDLRTKIVLPTELIDGMDELRLLGNDAAHVEAKEFSQISKAELDVAIEFTREILKALYQYAGLLQKLRSLKAP
jgi:hypothetical protein